MILQDKVDILTKFLETQPVATVATIGAAGNINTALVYYFLASDLSIYFVTKVETRKYTNITKNAAATLFVFSEAQRTTVEVSGQVVVVTDLGQVSDIIQKFQEQVDFVTGQYWVPPIAQLEAGQYVVCRMVPDGYRYKNFSHSQSIDGEPEEFYFDLA